MKMSKAASEAFEEVTEVVEVFEEGFGTKRSYADMVRRETNTFCDIN